VLTLLVLPTYYTLFDDLAVWLKRTWLASNPGTVTEIPKFKPLSKTP